MRLSPLFERENYQSPGRDDIGYLAPGMAADFIAINIDKPGFVGAHQDFVAATIFCQTDYVDYSFINGKKIVDRGHLTTLDLEKLIEKSDRAAIDLIT